MSERTDLPQQSYTSVALAIAEVEGVPINQRHLRDAALYVEAAACDAPGCLILRGHDGDHSPVFAEAVADREQLLGLLGSMVATQSGPLADLAKEVLGEMEARI